ncbi:TRAP transporter large permease subunit [Schinkia azotoformans]|uniref:TRAP dicarboxylate transporter subunit DctM n=1 Tax=Schinkia azotoformans LMG 9581 TaxID=1131731 RepID=K6DNU1_SCHAZ|nr:TRAP transporter large permease subunit [Schinkia azotoformans]EKN62431.1 TRAP dicarboxylate transporter subunit DctM [Schinkia azotoformans LMG 9581]MEC1640198.1 TRAP transporter large permease subunit [Schinkia azotoformans]MEC1720583.1 TRAP transporter large permease subunit [Schinkia azotoformans]MEC1945376.1 TRAP transporter large permease subunit [Schinkia azotoformans]MED4353934.1 TRAP transporter large permease subunit [Schinkia azotoformans]
MNAVPKQTLEQPLMPKSGTPLKKYSSLFFIVLSLVGVIYSVMIGSAALAVFSLLFLCLFLGLPIAISLGLASFAVIYFFTTDPLPDLAGKVFSGLDNFPLMAIPFFVLAGNIFTTGGVAKRLINLANAYIGHLPGGLSIAAIMSCALFAAISGSSPATVAAIGGIMIPAMVKFGYPKSYGVGSIATAGSLGILIPPSVPMIVYCVTVEQSVGRMFLAGIVPGIFLAGLLAFVSFYVAKKNKYPLSPKATFSEKMKAFRESIWSLSLPILVIGGIYSGLFTPTESAAVACFFGLIVGFFIHRDLRIKDIPGILIESTKTTAMLFFIIAMAMVFAHILTLERIPHELVSVIKDMNMGPIAFLLIVNLILFIAGQFMEPTAIITILAPILFPVAMALGIDPIHFGIIIIVNMEIGMITPPVGLNLYVASGISKMSLVDVTKATGPWLLATVVALAIVTFVPQLSLWLPNFLYGLQ